METDLLQFAQKLAQGARAKAAEERQRLEKLQVRDQRPGEVPPTPGR